MLEGRGLEARLMADPKAVLAEYDMPVPDGMDVKVVENSDTRATGFVSRRGFTTRISDIVSSAVWC